MAEARRPLVYLIAIEDVARSPLIRSQVLPLLKALAAAQPERAYALVALYPIFNWLRFRRDLAQLRRDLASDGISLHVYPIVFLTRYFYIPRTLLPLYLAQALLWALWISWRLRPALLHCRSYPATLVGRMIKQLLGAALFFDTRALYAEEGAMRRDGGQSRQLDAASFQLWKQIERALLARADTTAVVAQATADILSAEYPTAASRIAVFPTCTRVATQAQLSGWRQQTRAELGLEDRLVVAYAGSWFAPAPAIELFRRLLQLWPDARWHFLLLVSDRGAVAQTQPNHALGALIRQELGAGIGCTALSAPQAEVARYLAGADLAAQPVAPPAGTRDDPRFARLAQTALSIKFPEYLACGLPVLVSQWHGAAAAIAQAHDLGIVYDQHTDAQLAGWLAGWLAQRDSYRQRTWSFAQEHFSLDRLRDRYLAAYQRLLSPAAPDR